MQLANILLALGGDKGNTVPKTAITPSELAVLQVIHGNESVTDIEPYGQVERSSRTERARLVEKYGRIIDGVRRAPAVDELFPGVASRLFQTFDELDLNEDDFKAVQRVGGVAVGERIADLTAAEQAIANETVKPLDPLDHDGDGKKGGSKKGSRKKAVGPAPEPEVEAQPEAAAEPADDEDANDGIGDMPDSGLFK